MIDIEKEIKKCKHLDNIYILKESGDRTKKYPRIENINSADITQASVKVYNSYTHMYSTKSIYESKKGYYIKANGKRLYLDNFEEGEAMTENKKIEQLKKRIDKVFDKITTDEIEQRIKEDKLLDEEIELMSEDKKIEQLVAIGVKSINISKEKYEKLRTETKNLIKLNDVKLNFIEEEK